MKPPVKLIVFDLDGTVLNSKHEITPRTAAVFKKARAAGIHLVPATGRQYAAIPEAVRRAASPLLIANNGAQVYTMPEQKVVMEKCFDADAAVSLVRELREYDGMIFAAHDNVGAFDNRGKGYESGVTDRILENNSWRKEHPLADVESMIAGEKKRFLKMAIIFEDLAEREKALGQFIKRSDLYVTFYDNNNIEIMPAGMNKGEALKFCAKRLGVPLEQVMAIGDSDNDKEMLRAAGYSVAMGNASPEIRAAADETAGDCEDDGAALAIEAALRQLNRGPAS
ncbi:MAG: Cof-type HAD-IIB family hydrolase [Treponema sp.]|jgi:Cof subfamily protein (haloacid dehalogenase superfamily)|nr:Cof-type HAD-IIB family hydrolase [Treponema sp.]